MKEAVTHYQFFQKIKALPFIEAIYLFGSRARNDNFPRSDIDIAIKCPSATDADWHKVLDIIEEADTLLEIDCIRLDTEKNSDLLDNIQKYHKVLYKKGN